MATIADCRCWSRSAGPVRGRRLRDVVVVLPRSARRLQDQLQLAHVAPEVGEQAVPGGGVAAVVALRGRGPAARGSGQRLPEIGGGVGEPQVDVPAGGERGEHRGVLRLEPGGAEHRDPFRQVADAGVLGERGGAGGHALGRAGRVHLGPEPPPELGLPGAVRAQRAALAVDVAAGGPGLDHGGPDCCVAGEEARQVARGRPSAASAALTVTQAVRRQAGELGLRRVAEVLPQHRRPCLPPSVVQDTEQRPHRPLRAPRVLSPLCPGRAEGTLDQPGERREVDPRAHAVPAVRAGAQLTGEPLRQPPLDARGRDAHHLDGEGIGQRRGEQAAQRSDQTVGTLGAVNVQAHDLHPRAVG